MKAVANHGVGRVLACTVSCCLLFSLLLARPSALQLPAQKAAQSEAPAKPAEQDPLGRSSPYGTVTGFVRAAQVKDYARAVQYLDTRKTGAAAEELAQHLQGILDRGLKADLDKLSRQPEGNLDDGLRANFDRVGTVTVPSGELEILVERVERGGKEPIWLFASETLALVSTAKPQRSGLNNLDEYVPGPLVETTLLGIPIYRWVGMILSLALALLLGALITRALVPVLRLPLRHLTGEEDDRSLTSLRAPIRLILIALVIRLFSALSASLAVRFFWTRVAISAAIVGVAWLVTRLNYIVFEFGARRLRRRQMGGRIAVLTLIRRLITATVCVVAALWLLQRAGADLTAVLTGLGIGGLGVAFAAQKTLENLFGGITIIMDEPMRVGDFCKVGDQMGTIEDIGVRSTRIRTLSRTIVAVPNGQLAVMNVENLSLRDKFWLRHVIGVRYETSADQLRYLLAEVRSMLYAHPKVEREGARIRFVAFSGSSLDLEIFAYVRAFDMGEFLAIQEDILLRVMDIVAAAGTSIAFPSQTTYLARDTPLDPQKSAEVVAQVRQWREQGELPFPDFSPEQLRHLRERIEYPPPGSSLRDGR
jgi:MscS family membrane protein